jgi:hypothetical protein
MPRQITDIKIVIGPTEVTGPNGQKNTVPKLKLVATCNDGQGLIMSEGDTEWTLLPPTPQPAV